MASTCASAQAEHVPLAALPEAPVNAVAPRRLSLVPAQPDDDAPHVTVPVPRSADLTGTAPWRTQGEVAFVPAVLLLAASGRCSCDDCCAVFVREQRRKHVSSV